MNRWVYGSDSPEKLVKPSAKSANEVTTSEGDLITIHVSSKSKYMMDGGEGGGRSFVEELPHLKM